MRMVYVYKSLSFLSVLAAQQGFPHSNAAVVPLG